MRQANLRVRAAGASRAGPRYLWTRSAGGRTRTRQLAAAELDKVRREIADYKEFVAVTEQIVQVNEAICEARPVSPPGRRGDDGAPPPGGEKGGSATALEAEASAEIGRLAAEAARSLGCDAGLEAAETVIRAGMLKLGGACWRSCWPPTPATAARGWRAGRGTRRSSSPTGTR